MSKRCTHWLSIVLCLCCATFGCQKLTVPSTSSTWHDKFNWKAEDYFEDAQVISLCHAIERSDVAEINRLVAAGADVNALGHGKMTPLMWAFPDKKLERFTRMLELGADPNVIIESDFGTRGAIAVGTSVTHLAAETRFPGYFEAVFSNGGDPNLRERSVIRRDDTPLFTLIKAPVNKKREKVQFLVDKGADLNHVSASSFSAPMQAVAWFGQYDIALALLEAGADPRLYQWNSNRKLIHMVAAEENSLRSRTWTPQQKKDYLALVHWLESHGESVAAAKAEDARWQSWSSSPKVYRRKMDAEVAARKLKEPPRKAEDYFDDPMVVELCRAIDKNDLAEVDRLIEAGANLNAEGRGKMTPLLWAFPAKWMLSDPPGRLDAFKRLSEHGANPNVLIDPTSAMRADWLQSGESVTQLAASSEFPGYFDAVFERGGDVKLQSNATGVMGDTPLFAVVKGKARDKTGRIAKLIEKDADLNHLNYAQRTACMEAVERDEFDVALMLLESGAKFDFAAPKSKKRVVHSLIEKRPLVSSWPEKRKSEYMKLMDWLDTHGESLSRAEIELIDQKGKQRHKH
jgi:ankyrin repeat protein